MISPSDTDWDSVVVAGARVISDWAAAGQFHFYSELAEAVNAEVPDADLEAFGHPMNRLLYDVVMTGRSFDPECPMLSAVVVLKDRDNRQPGPGFWELATELGLYGGGRDDGDHAAFWGQEFARCTTFWTRTRRRDFDRWLRQNGPTTYS